MMTVWVEKIKGESEKEKLLIKTVTVVKRGQNIVSAAVLDHRLLISFHAPLREWKE